MFPLNVIPYAGFAFWAISSLFVFIHWLLALSGNRPLVRNFLMITVSYFIIASVIGNQLFVILLLLIVVVHYAGSTLISAPSTKSTKRIYLGITCLIIFILCYFKYSYFQSTVNLGLHKLTGNFLHFDGISKHIFFIGVSYFSFKFIHVLIDCHNKKIKKINLLTFINYILFFPSFFSGPINRYNLFAKDIHDSDKGILASNYMDGVKRIINGLFKKIVLANSLLPYTITTLNLNDPVVTPLQAVAGVYIYMFYIYFDFSGYTDMAIGCGKLVGIELPENFNYPFFKRNLQKFWANWHMSLTAWLTDYIYWPIVRKFRHISDFKKKPVTTSNICIIITFMVCGLWHGDGLNFFIWGTYHGVGLAILNIYTFIERKYFSNQLKIFINKSHVGYALSTFVTFQYVAFGFLLFGCNLAKQEAFFRLIF